MSKLKLKLDNEMAARLEKVAQAGGYTSIEEFVLHILERELEVLDPGQGDSEEDIRKKMEGLGYMD